MSGARRSLLLAFDFGSQFIGAAAGSRTGGTPTPLSVVRVFRSGPDWDAIDKLVERWEPRAFVVGLALNARREHTAASRKARHFGHELERRYNRPVHWVDETLSTEAARTAMRSSDPGRKTRKENIDNTAAALILESFLEAHR